jgi:hypothetical protein
MKKWLSIMALALVALIPRLGMGQTISFFTDRAVGVFPGPNRVTVLVPIAYGRARICQFGATGSPCTPLATVFDLSGNTLTVSGGNFGQITTDVVGRFSFGCTPGSYLVQVAASGSNTPQLSYPITCAFPSSSSSIPGITSTGDILVCTSCNVKWGSLGILSPDLFISRAGNGSANIGSVAGGADGTLNLARVVVPQGGLVSGGGAFVAGGTFISQPFGSSNTMQIGDSPQHANGTLNLGQLCVNSGAGCFSTVQGNGTKAQLSTGTTTTNNFVSYDANGNAVDSGKATPSGAVVGTTDAQVLASKTLTSPVINGTPTGTGIPTITLKKGTGAGNYTGTNTSFSNVDGTNLSYTVTIPTGWKLSIQVSAAIFNSTATANVSLAIVDGSVLIENQITGVLNQTAASTLSWVINGDGASHTITLQVKTTNGADAWNIFNDIATRVPTMIFNLSPSN